MTELKTFLRITNSSDDTELTAKLTAASRRVDRDCGRRFYQDNSTSARTYRATHEQLLTVDDVSTATGLVVDFGASTTWTTVSSTTYDLLPENAEVDGKAIETLYRSWGYWPICSPTRVRVTAKWGWAAVPDEIKAATLLAAARLFRRKDSIESVQGFGDLGIVRLSRYDPDYDALIGPYRRVVA